MESLLNISVLFLDGSSQAARQPEMRSGKGVVLPYQPLEELVLVLSIGGDTFQCPRRDETIQLFKPADHGSRIR